MRLRSWEKRFVTTPVSVFVKKESGARIKVCKACWWRLAPAFFTETMKSVIPRRRRARMAQICRRA